MDDIFDSFPFIKFGDGFILRKISSETDHVAFYEYMTRKEVRAYLSPDDTPASLIGAKLDLNYWDNLYSRKASIYWAIAIENNNSLIGTCGFNYWNKSQRRAEISYDLDYKYWGRGITTEAIRKIVEFGLQEMKIQRIQATVAIDNFPSIKVLEKNNFKKEGILEKYGVLEEKTKDFYMYAICS